MTCRSGPPGRGVDERGSAAVIVTALAGVLVTAAALLAVVGGAVVDQRRVESAVDLGALAGAAAVQRGQDGCAAARSVVARNRAQLTTCSVAGDVIWVSAARHPRTVLGIRLTVTSRARAGPEGSAADVDPRQRAGGGGVW